MSHQIKFGKIKFLTEAEYNNSHLDPDNPNSLANFYLPKIGLEPLVDCTESWPDINRAICCDGVFKVNAVANDCEFFLQFDPKYPKTGTYEIHWKIGRSPERGRVLEVINLDGEPTDYRTIDLLKFSTIFKVITLSISETSVRKIWRIGLERFDKFSESDIE